MEHEFLHNRIYKPYVAEAVETPEGRRYPVHGGHFYESITAALSNHDPEKKKGLDAWRKRVGEEEANRISRLAANRGTHLHDMAEQYLKNDIFYADDRSPMTLELFNTVKPIFDEKITEVYLQEEVLFSHKLQLAGRVDCICRYNGLNSIVDFKTSGKPKQAKWIHDYFLQATAYCVMFNEMYKENFKQIVIIIAVEDNPPQVFVRNPARFIKDPFFTKRLEK